MQAIFLLCTLLVCVIVLLKLSWSGGGLETQNSTNSTNEVVFHEDPLTSNEWFKNAVKHSAKESALNTITDDDIVKSKARIQKLLTILRRQPAKDNHTKDLPAKSETTNELTNVDATIDCNPILEDDCGPDSIGPRLSATLLKILA